MVQFLALPLLASAPTSLHRAFLFSGMVVNLFTSCSGQTGSTKEEQRQAFADADKTLKEAEVAGVAALCSLLHDPHFIKREMAAYELGSMDLDESVAMEGERREGRIPQHPRGPEALGCLLTTVNDTSMKVRAFTVTALGTFPEHRADSALKVQLDREQAPEVRKRLLVAIGNQLEQHNAAFLSTYPAPTLADSMGIVLGAQELARSGMGSARLVERCLPMYGSPALHGMVVELLTRTDTATLVDRTDRLLAFARSHQGKSEQRGWCHVFARIPGTEAEAYLTEVATGGLTARDRETARTFLARRQRER